VIVFSALRTRPSAASASRSPSGAVQPLVWKWCLFISFCTSEIDSTPPGDEHLASPARMRCAASAMVCRPEEQKRFTVMPGTCAGSRRDRDLARDVPSGRAFRDWRADDHVSNSSASTLARSSAACTTGAHLRRRACCEPTLPALAERRAGSRNDDSPFLPLTH